MVPSDFLGTEVRRCLWAVRVVVFQGRSAVVLLLREAPGKKGHWNSHLFYTSRSAQCCIGQPVPRALTAVGDLELF
jgi:hypothetical protein